MWTDPNASPMWTDLSISPMWTDLSISPMWTDFKIGLMWTGHWRKRTGDAMTECKDSAKCRTR